MKKAAKFQWYAVITIFHCQNYQYFDKTQNTPTHLARALGVRTEKLKN